MKSTAKVLKEFGLTDDEILDVAIEPRLKEAVEKLKWFIRERWIMDTITAMKTVEALKKELI